MASISTANVQEYTIKVPKSGNKRYQVMRFNGTLDVDFSKWTQVKMERENNFREYKLMEEDQPKFGAGSEFGREAKEEARRKKLGIVAKKYRPEDQPWILKTCGANVKKFKGIREGGVSENTAYYVFTHAADGAIEAFPLQEWYKFQSIQRYKALSAEEAELEFTKRNKHLNYFSLMLRKRLKGENDEELEEEEKKLKKESKNKKELKISDMDEWMDSSEDDADNSDDKEGGSDAEKEEKQEKKKKKPDVKKNKKRDTDLEAVEDSDDGDGEGRELDYISDSSNSEPDTNLESVAEEKALRKLLTSDEDSEDDENKSDKDASNNEEDEKEKEPEKIVNEEKPKKSSNSKKKKLKITTRKDVMKKETNSDFSSDSSTDEDVKAKKDKKKRDKNKKTKDVADEGNSTNSSRSATPIDHKRKMINDAMSGGPSSKMAKLDLPNYVLGSNESGITEDAVRKYLMRKPMTTTELLQKFKSKKTGLSSDQLVNIMTQILKKINPVKQTLKGKMYLSIKS